MRIKHLLLVLFIGISLISFGQKSNHIIILHTNDTHSQIEPSIKNGEVLGGVLRRESFINQEREENKYVILVDAGDFCQGSPYFNYFKGNVEIEMMNGLKYDVVTLGNHEFDNGCKVLGDILKKASFKVVCSNYSFKNKNLSKIIKPNFILVKGNTKFGFFGLLTDIKDITSPKTYQQLTYQDAIKCAKEQVDILKNQEHCDVIICLSHLGFVGDNNDAGSITDQELAKSVDGIDYIIGGHSHTLLQEPVIINHTKIVQVGYNGGKIGKITIPNVVAKQQSR